MRQPMTPHVVFYGPRRPESVLVAMENFISWEALRLSCNASGENDSYVSESYAVAVYYDAVFGTFAFISTPGTSEPHISGMLRNALGQPEALQEVTLINKGRQFTTRTNEQGQYAFYSTTIEPGDTLLVAGAVQKPFVFSGEPLRDLELCP